MADEYGWTPRSYASVYWSLFLLLCIGQKGLDVGVLCEDEASAGPSHETTGRSCVFLFFVLLFFRCLVVWVGLGWAGLVLG